MKNKELIKILQKLDPEMDVVLYTSAGEDGGVVNSVQSRYFDDAPYMKGVTFKEINPNLTQPFIIINSK